MNETNATENTMSTELVEEYYRSEIDPKGECGFCYLSEQGKHGEVRRVWSSEWWQYIPLCEKHAGVEKDAETWR